MAESRKFTTAMDHLLSQYQSALKMGLWIGTKNDCLYAYHSHQLFPAASTIKLAIYRYYLQQIKNKQIYLEEPLHVSPKQVVGGAGILSSMPEKACWNIQELLLLMLAVSDNTATNVLIDKVGLSAIQASLTGSEVCLARYLMKPEQNKENWISAAASANLLKDCLTLEATLQIKPSLLAQQQFQEGLPGLLVEADLPKLKIYNKTGRLHLIEHDVACFEINQQRIYLAGLSYDREGTGKGIMWLREIGQIVYQHLLKDRPSD